jgi:hypothetical protein
LAGRVFVDSSLLLWYIKSGKFPQNTFERIDVFMQSNQINYNKEWLESLTDDDFCILVSGESVCVKCANCGFETRIGPTSDLKIQEFCPNCGRIIGKNN